MDPDTFPTCGVAVLTWRGENVTRRCLASLRRLPEWPDRILVVDSASGTGEGARLAAEHGISAITLARNEAVAGGYNAAIGWAWSRGLSHVLLLNNDTEVDDPALTTRLLAAAADDVAAVGPVVVDPTGGPPMAGGRVSTWTGRARRLLEPAAEEPYEVDWVDGSALLVSVAAARVVGGLSLDFHLYWEETDWCVRARRAGWRVLVEPRASIRHARGTTVPGLQMRTWSLRNALLFLRRHATGAQLVVGIPAWLFVRVPVYLVRVGRTHGVGAALHGLRTALGWNLRDAARRGVRVPATGPAIERPA